MTALFAPALWDARQDVTEAPDTDPWRALFDRARGGDDAALEELCTLARPRLYRAAFALLKDPDEADDIAQEALVRAVTKRFLFLGKGSVGGWMSRIAVNLAKNRLRDRGRRREILDQATEGELSAQGSAPKAGPRQDEALEEDEERARTRVRVQGALAELTPRQREVAELRLLGELPFADIGASLGITEANARVTFSQARKRLAKLLEEEGEES
jgi:RNA polymerase sigma-70 factor (ECF subfamily)